MAIGQNCPIESRTFKRSSTGSVVYLTTRGSVVLLLCLQSRSKTAGCTMQLHCKPSSERSLGFSCSKLPKNSHWIIISFSNNAELICLHRTNDQPGEAVEAGCPQFLVQPHAYLSISIPVKREDITWKLGFKSTFTVC